MKYSSELRQLHFIVLNKIQVKGVSTKNECISACPSVKAQQKFQNANSIFIHPSISGKVCSAINKAFFSKLKGSHNIILQRFIGVAPNVMDQAGMAS